MEQFVQGTIGQPLTEKIQLPFKISSTALAMDHNNRDAFTQALIALETRTDFTKEEVLALQSEVQAAHFEPEEKQHLLKHIQWLQDLLKFKEQANSDSQDVTSYSQALQKLAFCPQMPLKQELEQKLTEKIEAIKKVQGIQTNEEWLEELFQHDQSLFMSLSIEGRSLLFKELARDERALSLEVIVKKAKSLLQTVQSFSSLSVDEVDATLVGWNLFHWNRLAIEVRENIIHQLQRQTFDSFRAFVMSLKGQVELIKAAAQKEVTQQLASQTAVEISAELAEQLQLTLERV